MARVQVTLDDGGLGAYLAGLQTMQGVQDGLVAAGRIVLAAEQVYPSASSRPQPFKTDKSRRWFFWALRNGLIQVPYVRTQALASSWVLHTDSTTQVTVGTEYDKAPLMKSARQTAYHRVTGWETAAASAIRVEGQAVAAFDATIGRWLG